MTSVEEVDKHVLRKYELQQKLGKGAYAVVFKAIDKKHKSVVALKKIFDAFQNATDAQRTFREIMYLQAMTGHENIIRLQNVLKAENDKDIYLVFDYMETDLHAVIHAKILEPVHKQFIVYQMLKALKYCHSGGLVHRDLKPSNLLLNEECLLKVADFGLARSLRALNESEGSASVLTDYVATRWYRAPEIILGSNSYTYAVDMWAVGCIIAEMFIGKPMIPGSSTMNQLEKILQITGPPSAEDVASIESRFAETMLNSIPPPKKLSVKGWLKDCGAPDEAIHMIQHTMTFNPHKRLDITQSLKHPYMAQFYTGEEPVCPAILRVPIDDDHKFTVDDYRQKLYQTVVDVKKDRNKRMALYFGLRS
uniref:Mitogen-activated protein kinase n=1 Tax=Chrysotila carterae TaxID=13221 RepID=A0A7S4B662_CHRCT|mmetsp:Transcript_16945/g.33125  ORF Transcript_16945/g.33125 Transcript_16945/m.33125 type:complete len:365 (+) Transcript_16945:173-1267(+)